jgi:DNA-binding CsgD family transcriptional regulator
VTREKNTVAAAALAAPATRGACMPAGPPVQGGNRSFDAPLASFGAQTASFVSQVLSADWSCFYQVDEHSQPFGFQAHRTPWAVREAYLKHDIARSDPMHPTCLAGQNIRFLSIFDGRLSGPLQSRRTYWNFLSSFGARDAAEMIFRVRGRAVAGLSLVWVGKSGACAERHQGEVVQSYVEFNLSPYFRAGPVQDSGDSGVRLPLTERELDIVQLICDGLTNAQIAHRLNIGLSTVKTHLLHVFDKLGVQSRAALVSRFLSLTRRTNA